MSHGHPVFKPTSAGRRFYTVSDFNEITTDRASKKLCRAPRAEPAARNNYGRITSRFRGGGHKQRYRVIDWKREQDRRAGQGRARSSTIRTARRASRLLHYVDGEKRYILAPDGLKQGDTVVVEPQRGHQARATACRSRYIPLGHHDPQPRDEEGQGRAARALGRRLGAAHGARTATTLRSGCRAVRSARSTSSAAPPSARSPTSSTRTSASARPGARAGSAGVRTTAASP